MSLDLVVLRPDAGSTEDDAVAIWQAESGAEPENSALAQFAAEVDARFTDEDWPFTGDPIVCPEHVSLVVAPDEWQRVVPGIVALAHEHGLTVLDPRYEGDVKLFPPGTRYE